MLLHHYGESVELVLTNTVTDRVVAGVTGFDVSECLAQCGHVAGIHYWYIVRRQCAVNVPRQPGESIGRNSIIVETTTWNMRVERGKVEAVAGEQEAIFSVAAAVERAFARLGGRKRGGG